MKLYGVRPSFRLSVHSFVPAAGLLLWAQQAGVIGHLLQQWCAAGECGQC